MSEALRKAALEFMKHFDSPCGYGELHEYMLQRDRLIDSLRAALSTPEISGQGILDNSTPEPSREPTQEQVEVEFERYALARMLFIVPAPDKQYRYFWAVTEEAWQAWQAAHAAGFEAGMRAGRWKPIETAPKDGTALLLGYLPNERIDRHVYEGRWDDFQRTWASVNGFLIHGAATHWMPLPPPPEMNTGLRAP
jgi:hypothetical protein